MATINLGSIKFKWQGAYAGGTAYTVDDVVSYNGSSYICILASTGNLPTNATYWEQMSSAGTNGTDGTDLGTTLTTQGDIVYRDASGLARLGAGTSGQVLQTNGTGANPSWGTVSSDYVKLYNGTVTSGSSLVLSNIFTTTYKAYKIFIFNYRASGSNSDGFRMRFRNNSDNELSTSVYMVAKAHPMVTGSTTSGINTHGQWNNDHIKLMDNGIPSGSISQKGYSAEITIFDPKNSSFYTQGFLNATYMNASNGQYSSYAGGFSYEGTESGVSGVTIYDATNSFSSLDYAVYGIK